MVDGLIWKLINIWEPCSLPLGLKICQVSVLPIPINCVGVKRYILRWQLEYAADACDQVRTSDGSWHAADQSLLPLLGTRFITEVCLTTSPLESQRFSNGCVTKHNDDHTHFCNIPSKN